jgi:uncharacterized protein (TIGR02246 family)
MSMLGAIIAKSKVREGFASISRGDVEAFVSIFAEDGVVVYPTKGAIEGKKAIRSFYDHFIRTFPKIDAVVHHAAVENIFDMVGTNVICTQFEISTTNRKGITFKQEGMQLIKIKRGKLTLLRYFFFDIDNLRHAWKESE